MCGIVGLFTKTDVLAEQLGAHVGEMIMQLSDRGPDSAGVAFYREPAPAGSSKVSLFSHDAVEDWIGLGADFERRFPGSPGTPEVHATHAVFVVAAEAEEVVTWLREERPDLRVMSAGRRIEIFKE